MASIYNPRTKSFVEGGIFPGSVGNDGTIYAGGTGSPDIQYNYVGGNFDNVVGDTLTNKVKKGAGLVPYDEAFAAQQAARLANGTGKTGSKFNLGGIGNKLGGFTINGTPLKQWFKNMPNANLGWTSGSGLQGWGKNLGKQANVVGGIYQLANAASKAERLGDARDAYKDVAGDVLLSANNNPLLSQYLTTEQLSQIRNLRNNGTDVKADFGDFVPKDISDWGNIGMGALTGFITGGVPGAIIGGVGNAVSGGIENVTEEQQMSTQELEALLAAVQEAEMQYKSMKRPALGGLGIQQRYLDMYR